MFLKLLQVQTKCSPYLGRLLLLNSFDCFILNRYPVRTLVILMLSSVNILIWISLCHFYNILVFSVLNALLWGNFPIQKSREPQLCWVNKQLSTQCCPLWYYMSWYIIKLPRHSASSLRIQNVFILESNLKTYEFNDRSIDILYQYLLYFLIWPLQPFSKDYNLVSYTTHFVYVNLM